MRTTKKTLLLSVMTLLICISLFIGTTLAWFVDTVTTGRNTVISGDLDVELKHYTTDPANAQSVKDSSDLFSVEGWEPGVIAFENFVVSNEGTLELKYDLTMNVFDFNSVTVDNYPHNLSDVLKVTVLDGSFTGTREQAQQLAYTDSLESFSKSNYLDVQGGTHDSDTFCVVVYWQPSDNDNIYNLSNGAVSSDGEPLYIDLGVNLVAGQKDYEADSFDKTYDESAKTHDHEYHVQPSGAWKCNKCSDVLTNTGAPYVLVDPNGTVTADGKITEAEALTVTAQPLTPTNAAALTGIGVTIKQTNSRYTYVYENKGADAVASRVYIRMNGGDLAIDAPLDTVHRYGTADDCYIMNVADHSYVENGSVNDIVMLGSGHIEISERASVVDLSVAKYAEPADVTITLNGDSTNVGTIAVYNTQSAIVVEKKSATQAQATQTTPQVMQNNGESVVIINDETARVGTKLFSTVDDAIAEAETKGNKEAARIVNDETLPTPAAVPQDTVLKVAAYIQVNVTDQTGINLNDNGMLVNVGTIVNSKDQLTAPVGLSVNDDAEIVNYGGFFDSVYATDNNVPDGGIFNNNGQKIENDGTITNIGNIENAGMITNKGDVGNSGNITNKTTDSKIENTTVDSKLTNDGKITNEGEITNSGTVTNNGSLVNKENSELNNSGTVTNDGDLKNDGTITNSGSDAVLDLTNGSTDGDGTISNENGATVKEENKEDRIARIGSKYYETLASAISAATEGKTVSLAADTSENVSIHGVDNLTIDLNGHTLTGTVNIYDCKGTTIKDGTVSNTSGIAFRIGEHQSTNVRWKRTEEVPRTYPCPGYHPLPPAQGVIIENVTATAKHIFQFTNIEDDYTRDGQQKCYGIYTYKTGYQRDDQYLDGGYSNPEKQAEVFNSCTDIDSVTVKGGVFNYTTDLVQSVARKNGNDPEPLEGHSIDMVYDKKVLTIQDAAQANGSDIGRFVAEGTYAVETAPGVFTLTTAEPDSYTAKINRLYFCYNGGGNSAVKYAILDGDTTETVYLNENATVQRTMGKGDRLDIVSDNGSSWSGAKAEKGYGIVKTVDAQDDTLTHFTTEIYVEASVWNKDGTKVDDYGTLKEAFVDTVCYDKIVKLESDITIDSKSGNVSGIDYGIVTSSRTTFDLNGHTYTYNGTGGAIVTYTQSGTTTFKDSKGGGKIVATNGYAIAKTRNHSTEYFSFEGGTYISKKSDAVNFNYIAGLNITGGTFIGKTKAFYIGTQVRALTVSGGTFISETDNALRVNGQNNENNDYPPSVNVTGGTFISPSDKEPISISSGVTTQSVSDNAKKIKCTFGSNQALIINSDGTCNAVDLVPDGSNYTVTAPADSKVLLPQLDYRIGYTYDGWFVGSNKVSNGNTLVKAGAEQTTFTARYTQKTAFNVTLNETNAAVSATVNGNYWNSSTQIPAGATVVFSVDYSEIEDRTCTIKDENGTTYTVGEAFTMPNADITVTASSIGYYLNLEVTDATVTATVDGEPWNGTDPIHSGSSVVVGVEYAKTYNQVCTIKSGNSNYTVGTEFTMPKKDVTVTASSNDELKFTKNETNATVTVTVNGEEWNGTDAILVGDTIVVTASYSKNNNQKCEIKDANGTNYTAGTEFTMPSYDVTVTASSDDSWCFAEGTLITLADGSKKAIEDITFDDEILTWSFFTGEFEAKGIALLVDHGEEEHAVINLVFSDGKRLEIIGEHAIFDYDANRFVYLSSVNCAYYVGHRFVTEGEDGEYSIAQLVDATVKTEVVNSYSITSDNNSNAFAGGLLTVAPPAEFYTIIEMGGRMRYDVDQFNADVAKYGLYTYSDFEDYVSYEQFEAFNGAYLKPYVCKGCLTFDDIIDLINLYKEFMPE